MSDERISHVWSQLTEPVQETYMHRLPPLKNLAHYCSFSAFQSIISNREIWFSPIKSMNDIEEITRGKELIIEYSKDRSHKVWQALEIIRNHDENLWNYINQEFAHRWDSDPDDTFISCWSECDLELGTEDDLAMWRGYGHNGNGVAIVIDPRLFLTEEGYESEIIACPVFYETEEEFAYRAATYFRSFVINLLALTPADREEFKSLAVQAFVDLCYYLSVTHKHPGFKQEREWRFVWRRNQYLDQTLEQFVSSKAIGSSFHEKFCLPLNEKPDFVPTSLAITDLIKGVTLGPCAESDLKQNAILTLLENEGFEMNATRVFTSTIPFRHRVG